MKKVILFCLIFCLLMCIFCPTFAENDNSPTPSEYIEFAKTQLGRTGADYKKSNGINFDWCAWFTTFCAFNLHICGSVDNPAGSIFPPLDRNAWESCNWAATGVTYQANWFMQNEKGDVYKFTPDSRLKGNSRLHNLSPADITPEVGDLIYFDWKQDRSWDHVAIVSAFNPETGEITFIGGNQGESKNWRECAVTEGVRETSSPEYAGLMKIDWSNARDLYSVPTERVNAVYKIKSDNGVKLRQGYGLTYGITDVLPDKEQVFVSEKTSVTCDGYIWGHTEYNGNSGWFAMKYSEFSEQLYAVTFYDWDGTELKYEFLHKGDTAAPPYNPSRYEYRFTGWDKPLGNITHDTDFYAQYEAIGYLCGDANGDSTVNTADAVCVLRFCAEMNISDFSHKNADINNDGTVNTGDAKKILSVSAGIEHS